MSLNLGSFVITTRRPDGTLRVVELINSTWAPVSVMSDCLYDVAQHIWAGPVAGCATSNERFYALGGEHFDFGILKYAVEQAVGTRSAGANPFQFSHHGYTEQYVDAVDLAAYYTGYPAFSTELYAVMWTQFWPDSGYATIHGKTIPP